jgi:hypothetical protein
VRHAREFAAAARSLRGVRWRPYGRSAATGLDCAGIVVCPARVVDVELQDERQYDPITPDPALLWSMCRRNLLEQDFGDAGEGRVGLCRWIDGGDAGHFVVMLADREIVHVDAAYRRVTVVPASLIVGRLLSVFRVPSLEYGEPWPP